MGGCTDICSVILAILLPPLGVLPKFGCGKEFCICFLLTFLGWLPGIIYALYVILVTPPPEPQEGQVA